MGALPSADSWQDYRWGVGPYVDGLFVQANFGIVTKMGFWLYPQPDAWGAGIVEVPNYHDFDTLVEHVNYLEDSHLMMGFPTYSSPLGPVGRVGHIPGKLNPELQQLMSPGWPSDVQIEDYGKKRGGPAGRARLQFYGPEKTIRANWEYTQERVARAIPGSTFRLEEILALPLDSDHD